MRRRAGEQHIGDADGLIALWLNEQSAYDLAAMFRHPDLAVDEILDAIERAYPKDEAEDREAPKPGEPTA